MYKVYSDPGVSGAKLDRPALKQLIKDVEKNKISKVLVYKLDRLSRRQKDTLYLIEDVFNANNVDFISMTEQLDTASPLGRAMIGIDQKKDYIMVEDMIQLDMIILMVN